MEKRENNKEQKPDDWLGGEGIIGYSGTHTIK